MSSKTEEPIIEISQVSHTYGSVLVLENINLKVMRGEFIAIVGPSDCGKTTLLNIISGFENPDEGSVCRRGKLSMIYHKDRLLPSYTVSENIELSSRPLNNREQHKKQTHSALRLIGLEGFDDQSPHR